MPFDTGRNYFAALRSLYGRTYPGPTANSDALELATIPSLQIDRASERILADIDQDGFLFARDAGDSSLFNARSVFYPRRKHELQVVYAHSQVCLRKRFGLPGRDWKTKALESARVYLLNEAAALRRLHNLGVAPRLIAVDFGQRTIDMEFIEGSNLRQIVARTHAVLDTDAAADPAIDRLTASEARNRVFAFASQVLPLQKREEILEAYRKVHAAGVIQRDLHPANILIGKHTGRPYIVDFELADLGAAATREKIEKIEAALAQHLQITMKPNN